MKFLEEFRDPVAARQLLIEIRRTASRPWTLMEVCGGQTHSLLRHGIDAALAGTVELIHGPGCPVCVTPLEAIDFARRLSLRDNVLLASFGDMLRVPGSTGSLADARAAGGRVKPVYSPLDAVELARRDPDSQVVFFAVGFETTTPATALAVRKAEALGLDNFTLLVAHVRVLPAMEAICSSPDCRVDGFLGAGHVCTITGSQEYQELVHRYRLPVVVTGFEPVDLLQGILECVRLLESGEARVANRYRRTARDDGNETAQRLVGDVFEVCDRPWRGLGTIARGGLQLRAEYARFDAEHRFGIQWLPVADISTCRSGDVLCGRIRPTECESFGTSCTPDRPLGAPMVSTEGACAAYYRYGAPTMGNSARSWP
jgi:hydrogenase expression/formation protein HypD